MLRYNMCMPKVGDLTGRRFGRLVALSIVRRPSNRSIFWLCQCDCGRTTEARSSSLTTENTTSCGCLHKESIAKIGSANLKHGHARNGGTRTHRIWNGMKQRCLNPNVEFYRYY